ncbi:FG-GAP repeat domain-containing protein [Streptomyces pristinaespiralis]|uniref:FG-GAP repeat domain-containing protein n=1 Tax=Streptomyces pristinaespiralis TaxID=38300 RepID=UPI0038372F51
MQKRSSGRRHAAAVTAVLAVTAGTLTAGPAALAVPAAGPAAVAPAAVAADPVPFPSNAKIAGAGATGFLTRSTDESQELRWTPYAGGAPTVVTPPAGGSVAATGTDVLVLGDANAPAYFRSVTLRNMADPASPGVSMDLGSISATYVAAVSPTSVLAQVTAEDGTKQLHLVSKEAGELAGRKVTGLPADAGDFFTSAPVRDGEAFVGYGQGPAGARTGGRAVIDLAAGKAVESYASGESGYLVHTLAFSDSHVVWSEHDSDGWTVVSVDRGTRAERRFPLGRAEELYIGLTGSRLVYATRSALTDSAPSLHQTVRATSLTGDDTVDLVAYTYAPPQPAADGSLLVGGGRVEDGEGLFRISTGQDGVPVVTQVASSYRPTAIAYLGSELPVLNFDRSQEYLLKWRLSRLNADVTVTLTHRATRQSFTREVKLSPDSPYVLDAHTFGIPWQGILDDTTSTGRSAYNGPYDWSIRVVPQNGIGPELRQTGGTEVYRQTKPHDFNYNGSPDLLSRDTSGRLWRTDTVFDKAGNRLALPDGARSEVGAGWGVYNTLENIGTASSWDEAPGIVARDTSGVLWLYPGLNSPTVPFSRRQQVGGGWQVYDKLAGSDLTGDHDADLVAADRSGTLWFYEGTGIYKSLFKTRKKIGGGWQIYNRITAVGNIAGGPGGDLIARDKDGVLWLYLGKGDGTFTARTRIGGGWNAYSELVGIGDGNRDGKPDLYAYGPNGTAYFYAGTGSRTAPFAGRTPTKVLVNDGARYDHVL